MHPDTLKRRRAEKEHREAAHALEAQLISELEAAAGQSEVIPDVKTSTKRKSPRKKTSTAGK